jgi:hypothetical protein
MVQATSEYKRCYSCSDYDGEELRDDEIGVAPKPFDVSENGRYRWRLRVERVPGPLDVRITHLRAPTVTTVVA